MNQTPALPKSSNVEWTMFPQECHEVIGEGDRVSTNLGKVYDICLHIGRGKEEGHSIQILAAKKGIL